MSDNMEPTVMGKLVKNHVIVESTETQKDLELKGLGEFNKNSFFLKPFESLYLLYTGKLDLQKNSKNIEFDDFLQSCIKEDPDALTKFLIFRDLRTKGYIVKDGFVGKQSIILKNHPQVAPVNGCIVDAFAFDKYISFGGIL